MPVNKAKATATLLQLQRGKQKLQETIANDVQLTLLTIGISEECLFLPHEPAYTFFIRTKRGQAVSEAHRPQRGEL